VDHHPDPHPVLLLRWRREQLGRQQLRLRLRLWLQQQLRVWLRLQQQLRLQRRLLLIRSARAGA